jgi:hypothetical protein
LAWFLALGTLVFAVVNIVFEMTGRFDAGHLSEYAAGLSIANWFVVVLKVIGAAVALLSVAQRQRLSARVTNTLIWGAAGTLGVYSIGNVGQAIAMATGVAGSIQQIDAAGVLYVLLFLLAAAGFAVLAVSHTKRSELGPGPAILGSVGGVVLLGIILLALPELLSALGIMPSS